MKFTIFCHGCGRVTEDKVPLTNDKDYFFDVTCSNCKFHLIVFQGEITKNEL